MRQQARQQLGERRRREERLQPTEREQRGARHARQRLAAARRHRARAQRVASVEGVEGVHGGVEAGGGVRRERAELLLPHGGGGTVERARLEARAERRVEGGAGEAPRFEMFYELGLDLGENQHRIY